MSNDREIIWLTTRSKNVVFGILRLHTDCVGEYQSIIAYMKAYHSSYSVMHILRNYDVMVSHTGRKTENIAI